MSITVKMTSKGQVTIPKEIRKILKSDVLEFEIRNGEVVLRAVESVSGRLSTYAKRREDFTEVREKVWKEVAGERAKKTP